MNRTPRIAALLGLGIAAIWALPAHSDFDHGVGAVADERESYSYLRTIEGTVTVAAPGQGPGETGDPLQPLLSGDQLRLARATRAEVLLADRNLLRLAGGTVLTLDRVAFSADSQDRSTQLSLTDGELVLVVTDEALGDALPEVRTMGAAVYIHEPGTYRIEADARGWTEVVVRAGYAELLTDRGSTIVRGGESARTSGDASGRVRLAAAGPEDDLEVWGRELDATAADAARRVVYVEPELAYAAAPLADHGTWIYVDAGWHWRPRVAVDWRPYWDGRWHWTPSGLTWVSYEPWGWVPYHYGTWVMTSSYGWCWRPGRVYSPAWVYWSWGDRWTGWCPVGYYTGYYGFRHHRGFRFGTYGWARGGWGIYADWNFVPSRHVRRRDWRPHQRTGRDLAREAPGEQPRGVLTTDTRSLSRERLQRPEEIPALLARRGRGEREELADVTEFVARKQDLPPAVRRAVEAPEQGPIRLAGTPLAPDSPRPARLERAPRPEGAPAVAPGSSGETPVARERGERPVSRAIPRAAPAPPVTDGTPAVEERRPNREVRPRPEIDRAPTPRPEVAPRPTGAPDAPAAGSTEDRQGWRRERGSETSPAPPRPGTKPRVDGAPAPRSGGYEAPAPREDPVRRVVGGVRRSPQSPGTEAPARPASGAETRPAPSPQRERDAEVGRESRRRYEAPAPDRTPRGSGTPSVAPPAPAPRPGSPRVTPATPRVSSPAPAAGPRGGSGTPAARPAPAQRPPSSAPAKASPAPAKPKESSPPPARRGGEQRKNKDGDG